MWPYSCRLTFPPPGAFFFCTLHQSGLHPPSLAPFDWLVKFEFCFSAWICHKLFPWTFFQVPPNVSTNLDLLRSTPALRPCSFLHKQPWFLANSSVPKRSRFSDFPSSLHVCVPMNSVVTFLSHGSIFSFFFPHSHPVLCRGVVFALPSFDSLFLAIIHFPVLNCPVVFFILNECSPSDRIPCPFSKLGTLDFPPRIAPPLAPGHTLFFPPGLESFLCLPQII